MRHILLITTGGTIACRDSGHGLAPALTAEDLLAAVPDVTRACTVTAMPLFNLDSTDMTPKEWMTKASSNKGYLHPFMRSCYYNGPWYPCKCCKAYRSCS